MITGDELAEMPDHDLCELIDGTKNLGIVMTGEIGIVLPGFALPVAAAFE